MTQAQKRQLRLLAARGWSCGVFCGSQTDFERPPPPELLLAEDIASVHLSGDTSIISGEKLQKAIADAVNAVAKKALPDSVFA